MPIDSRRGLGRRSQAKPSPSLSQTLEFAGTASVLERKKHRPVGGRCTAPFVQAEAIRCIPFENPRVLPRSNSQDQIAAPISTLAGQDSTSARLARPGTPSAGAVCRAADRHSGHWGDFNMAEIAQCALFISGCVFLYGLTVFLFRDQIKSGS